MCNRKQTSVTQIEHLLQTAEAIRRDGKPEWMQVVGLVHDLGKLLTTFQPEWVMRSWSVTNSSIFVDRDQWAIVGVSHVHSFFSTKFHDTRRQDTFPVGCRFSDKNIYPETFSLNPDSNNKRLITECGIYAPRCGLENILLSWGSWWGEVYVKIPVLGTL